MLMALTKPSQSADLSALRLDRSLLYSSCSDKAMISEQTTVRDIFSFFPHNVELCPVQTLQEITALMITTSSTTVFGTCEATQTCDFSYNRSLTEGGIQVSWN